MLRDERETAAEVGSTEGGPDALAPGFAAFRNRLIPGTMARGLELAFYKTLWAGVDVDSVRTVHDLPLLPVIDKSKYETDYEEFPGDEPPDFINFSSGTTGALTLRFRTLGEVQYQLEFVNRISETLQARQSPPTGSGSDGGRSVRLALTLDVGHGVSLPLPSSHRRIEANVKRSVGNAVTLLQREYKARGMDRHITEVICSPEESRTLTVGIAQRRIPRDSLHVRIFRLTGQYLTRSTRELLTNVWGEVSIMNRHSLSELTGGASECARCGLFHVDFYVVPEVLDIGTLKPIESGFGLLVMTELFPFVQAQPLVRYNTGDIVEVLPSPCAGLAYAYVGRVGRTPVISLPEGSAVLMSPAKLQGFLEGIPEVARASVAPHNPELADVPLGQPRAEFRYADEHRPVRLDVRVAATFYPWQFPQRTEALRSQIYAGILRDNPVLERLIGAGEAILEVTIEDPSNQELRGFEC